jgi:hypothetical protein
MNMNIARVAIVAAVTVESLPVIVSAQTARRTLENVVRRGQTVLVVEQTGAKVTGRVAEVSPHEIVLLTPDRRTFALDTVTRITRSDGVWNGALIGAAVGLGPAIGIWIAGACGGAYANSDRNCLIGATFVAGGASRSTLGEQPRAGGRRWLRRLLVQNAIRLREDRFAARAEERVARLHRRIRAALFPRLPARVGRRHSGEAAMTGRQAARQDGSLTC